MKRIAVIGLGSMGYGIARSLLRAGLPVVAHDVRPEVVERFEKDGGTGSASAAEACRGADAVVVVVVNAAQTRDILFGDEGCARHLDKGGVILSCATMAPSDATEFGAAADALGLLYIDGPISGGSVKAAAGELTVMASGSAAAFDRADAVLKAIAGKVFRLGDTAGLGSSYKMVNQLLAGVHIAAACEAITFGARLGLDLRKVYEVITASAGNSWMFENRIPHVLDGDYTPRSAINIFTKDLGIVGAMAEELDFPLPVAATALELYLATASAGMGCDDDASVARMIALRSGLTLPGMGDETA